MRRWILITIIALLATASVGCVREPAPNRQQDNYLERVGRVLEQTPQPWRVEQLSRYRPPTRRDLIQPMPALRLGLLDLIVDSRDCGPLQQLIAERNSSLGKVMPQSTLLGFEGELVRAIDECLAVIAEDPAREGLAADLSRIASIKRDNLHRRFWNALAGSEAFIQFVRFDGQPLPLSEASLSNHPPIEAVEQLARIGRSLPENLPPPRSETEPLFATLSRDQRSGQLIHTLARLIHTLEQTTAMLRARPANFLCPLGKPTERARILLNVFTLFYAGEVQPLMAQAQRLGEPWQAALSELRRVPGAAPAMDAYLAQLVHPDIGLWAGYRRSVAEHSEAWQDVLGACQMRPGQPGWNDRR